MAHRELCNGISLCIVTAPCRSRDSTVPFGAEFVFVILSSSCTVSGEVPFMRLIFAIVLESTTVISAKIAAGKLVLLVQFD